MEHLVVHLPYEAELGGPVQYRWMYSSERFFKHLKGKTGNKRYPAGSIVQSYMNDEIKYFSEQYFSDTIKTKPRMRSRFEEGDLPTYHVEVPDIFIQVGRHGGTPKSVWFTDKDYACAHATVLRNCAYFHDLERHHVEVLRYQNQGLSNDRILAKAHDEFPNWVKDFVIQYTKNRRKDQAPFPVWVHDLVDGPENHYKSFPMYFTRGYLFHTREHGQKRRTMNYGVCVRGQNLSDASNEEDFYGNIEEIIQLHYQGVVGLKITLFKCQWYDPTVNRGTRRRDGGRVVDVLATGRYNKYDPYVLDSQVDQVCYIPYPTTRRSRPVWLNVLKVNPRATLIGNYKQKELVLLQQETDEDVTHVPEIRVRDLTDATRADDEFIDIEVADAEPEDEFQCNLSSSDDDEDDVLQDENLDYDE